MFCRVLGVALGATDVAEDFFWGQPTVFPSNFLSTEKGFFFKSLRIAVSDQCNKMLYHSKVVDLSMLEFSTTVRSRMTHLGRASYGIQFDMYGADGSVPLITSEFHSVKVDMDTRKTDPWSSEIREKYNQLPQSPSHTMAAPDTVPEGAFLAKQEIDARYIDHNGHVNYLVYPAIAMDCLKNVCKSGLLGNVENESLLDVGFREINVLYQGEAKEGDVMELCLWQDGNDLWVFHTHVSVRGLLITYILLKYSPQAIDSKL